MDGNLKFEGMYLYGKKRKGKEYEYFNGYLQYEGEYLYDKIGMEKDMIKMVILYMN